MQTDESRRSTPKATSRCVARPPTPPPRSPLHLKSRSIQLNVHRRRRIRRRGCLPQRPPAYAISLRMLVPLWRSMTSQCANIRASGEAEDALADDRALHLGRAAGDATPPSTTATGATSGCRRADASARSSTSSAASDRLLGHVGPRQLHPARLGPGLERRGPAARACASCGGAGRAARRTTAPGRRRPRRRRARRVRRASA